jgi:hypothetical protein
MHFEQFGQFHRTFYRSVEATSVTPWAARALDRALAAVIVAAARHVDPSLTPEAAVTAFKDNPAVRDAVRNAIVARAPAHMVAGGHAALAAAIDAIADAWITTADDQAAGGNTFVYARKKSPHRLLHMPLELDLPNLAEDLGQPDRKCGRSRMTKNAQRLSQLISTFGPGAMIDLPTRSVVVAGLEFWETRANAFTIIPEPRLTVRLEQLLKDQGRLDPNISLSLRTPPVSTDGAKGIPAGVTAPVFPTWFVCEQAEATTAATGTLRRRRLVRWQDLDTSGRRRFIFDDGRKSEVTPIRFVSACEKGHLQDIDWRWVVHGSVRCQEALWVEEKGTSANPTDTSIVCGCGRSLSPQDAFQPGRLGKCRGERPWLLDRDLDGCAPRSPLPAASPVLPRFRGPGRGSKKRPRRTAFNCLILMRKSGAGEGIRTLDPNLGNVPEGLSPQYPAVRHKTILRYSSIS